VRRKLATWRRAAALLALLGATEASRALAHPLAPALLDIVEHPDGRTQVTWKTAVAQLDDAALSPVLPVDCRADGAASQDTDATRLTRRWTVRCGAGGLSGKPIAIDGLDRSQTDVLLRVGLADGRRLQGVLRPDDPDFVVPEEVRRIDVWRDYGRLGVEHVLGGPDHLLFVFGLLLLVPTLGALLRTVSAFTAGHSVTLSLAALGRAEIPSAPIEVLIAGSVFVLAVELAGSGKPTPLARRPWAMALGFGLLHGLGFASALREAGLPEEEVPAALLAFNLGIEAGQIAFVLGVLALGRAARPLLARAPDWIAPVPVHAMGALAASWVIERSLALL